MQGKTLEIVGIGVISDIYTKPFNNLNFNLSKQIGEKNGIRSTIKFQVDNILNEEKISVYKTYKGQDQIFFKHHQGLDFSIGYSFKF